MPRLISLAVVVVLAFQVAPVSVHAAGSGLWRLTQPGGDENFREAVKAVEAKRYRAAIDLLNKVLDKTPRNADALNYMGYSHRKLGEYDTAISYYKRALALDPGHRGANEYLGEAYVELGNFPAAEERLTALAKICGTDCKEYRQLKQVIDTARPQKEKAD